MTYDPRHQRLPRRLRPPACVRDGELVAAAEEERFRRIKHWAGFPSEAIRYCLREAGIGLADVDHVAINQDSQGQPRQEARATR